VNTVDTILYWAAQLAGAAAAAFLLKSVRASLQYGFEVVAELAAEFGLGEGVVHDGLGDVA